MFIRTCVSWVRLFTLEQSPHEYLLDLKERAQNSKIIVNLFDVWLKIGITV